MTGVQTCALPISEGQEISEGCGAIPCSHLASLLATRQNVEALRKADVARYRAKAERQACETAKSWPSHVMISVDIYASQLKDQLLPARVLKILEEARIAPSRLEVEITESALVGDMANAQAVLGTLRRSGVRIALDNFGTGYSSLYHLRNFKLDKIKIDRSFIHTIVADPASAGIVNALVGLGHGLGLTIAAEGVEATDQEGLLLSSGCEQGQGQLFSGPIGALDTVSLFGSDSTMSLYVSPRR